MLILRERTIGVLQRDRMAEFLKMCSDRNTGCFYLALFMSWNHVFPSNLVERTLIDDITNRQDGLGVSPRDAIQELKKREQQFNLRLTRVGITNFLEEDPEDFRDNANVPADIQVEREQYPLEILKQNESAIILWVGCGENGSVGLHYTSYHAGDNNRFAPEEVVTKESGYLPMIFLHLETR